MSYGGSGDDTIDGGKGADEIRGSWGFDTITFAQATSGVTLDLDTGGTRGDARGDTYSSIEQVIGTNYADIIGGTTDDDVIWGGAGNDTISSSGGDDTIHAGSSSRVVINNLVQFDNDEIDGGRGFDTVVYEGSRADYSWSWGRASMSNTLFVHNKVTGDFDQLVNVEALQFDNGTTVLL